MPCHWGALFCLVKNYSTTISEEHVQSYSSRRYKKNERKTKVTLQRRNLLDDEENIGSVEIDGASCAEKSGRFSGSHAGSVHSKMSQGSFVYHDSVKRLLGQDKMQKRGKLQDIFNSPSSEKEDNSDEKSSIWDPFWLKRVQKDVSNHSYDISQYLSSHSGFSTRAAPRSAHSYIQSRNSKNSSFRCSKTSEEDGQNSKKGHIYKRNVSMCGYVPKAVQNLQSSSALKGEKIDDFFLKCRLDNEQTKFASAEQVYPRVVSVTPQLDILSEDLEIMNEFQKRNDTLYEQQIMDGTISEIHTISTKTEEASHLHDLHNVVLHGVISCPSSSRDANDSQHDYNVRVDHTDGQHTYVQHTDGQLCLFDQVGISRSVDISDTNEGREICNQACDIREVTILTEKGLTDDMKLLLRSSTPYSSQTMDGAFNDRTKVLAQPVINPKASEVTQVVEMMGIGDSVLCDGRTRTPNQDTSSAQTRTNFTSEHWLDHYAIGPSSSSKTENSTVDKLSCDMPWKVNADVLY